MKKFTIRPYSYFLDTQEYIDIYMIYILSLDHMYKTEYSNVRIKYNIFSELICLDI